MDVRRLQGKLSEASGGLQDRRIATQSGARESRVVEDSKSCKARGARVGIRIAQDRRTGMPKGAKAGESVDRD